MFLEIDLCYSVVFHRVISLNDLATVLILVISTPSSRGEKARIFSLPNPSRNERFPERCAGGLRSCSHFDVILALRLALTRPAEG